jgi:hypothetical protein
VLRFVGAATSGIDIEHWWAAVIAATFIVFGIWYVWPWLGDAFMPRGFWQQIGANFVAHFVLLGLVALGVPGFRLRSFAVTIFTSAVLVGTNVYVLPKVALALSRIVG